MKISQFFCYLLRGSYYICTVNNVKHYVSDIYKLKNNKKMKRIMNVLKNEIFNLYNTINNLVKKVTASQETYLKDRTNETQFSNWSETVKDLQKAESDMRYLRSAYATICNACEVEPMTVEEIVAEKNGKAVKKAERKERKAAVNKDENTDGEAK